MSKQYIYAILASISILLFVVSVTLGSVHLAIKTSEKTGATEKVAPAPKPRIVLKAEHIRNSCYIYIYEIDSVEYLINADGGIYPLIKKQNDK